MYTHTNAKTPTPFQANPASAPTFRCSIGSGHCRNRRNIGAVALCHGALCRRSGFRARRGNLSRATAQAQGEEDCKQNIQGGRAPRRTHTTRSQHRTVWQYEHWHCLFRRQLQQSCEFTALGFPRMHAVPAMRGCGVWDYRLSILQFVRKLPNAVGNVRFLLRQSLVRVRLQRRMRSSTGDRKEIRTLITPWSHPGSWRFSAWACLPAC